MIETRIQHEDQINVWDRSAGSRKMGNASRTKTRIEAVACEAQPEIYVTIEQITSA